MTILTRDHVIWLVLLVSGVLTAVSANMNMLQAAFEMTERSEARIQFAAWLLSVIAAKLSWSPLKHISADARAKALVKEEE
jgi:hypothetical protein